MCLMCEYTLCVLRNIQMYKYTNGYGIVKMLTTYPASLLSQSLSWGLSEGYMWYYLQSRRLGRQGCKLQSI